MYKKFVKIISLKSNAKKKNLDLIWNKIPENKVIKQNKNVIIVYTIKLDSCCPFVGNRKQ